MGDSIHEATHRISIVTRHEWSATANRSRRGGGCGIGVGGPVPRPPPHTSVAAAAGAGLLPPSGAEVAGVADHLHAVGLQPRVDDVCCDLVTRPHVRRGRRPVWSVGRDRSPGGSPFAEKSSLTAIVVQPFRGAARLMGYETMRPGVGGPRPHLEEREPAFVGRPHFRRCAGRRFVTDDVHLHSWACPR